MEFYNQETGIWRCPCPGCDKTYKGLATLNNHFNDKHPSAPKPVWIVETHDRQAAAKRTAKNKAKAIQIGGQDYQAFKKAKWAELSPELSFEEKNKLISDMWKAAKAGKSVETVVPTVKAATTIDIRPTPTLADHLARSKAESVKTEADSVPLCDWVLTAIRRIAEEMDVDSINDLHINPDKAEKAIELIKSMITTPKPIETIDETIETAPIIETETQPESIDAVQWIDNPISKPDETTDEIITDETTEVDDETADVPYDAALVECCKTWREGGMAKAYKLINGFFTIKSNMKDVKLGNDDNGMGRIAKPYIVQKTDRKAHPASLTDVKELMEDIYDLMCDEWFDYTRSDDYNEETDADLFDDQAEWLDICSEAITEETVKMMLS